MYSPRRPLNECLDCRYTWHPRGKNVSNKCPNCGSKNVQIDHSGCVLFFLIVVIFGGMLYFVDPTIFKEMSRLAEEKIAEEQEKENIRMRQQKEQKEREEAERQKKLLESQQPKEEPKKTIVEKEPEPEIEVKEEPKEEPVQPPKPPWHETAHKYLKTMSDDDQRAIARIVIKEIIKEHKTCRFTEINSKKVEVKNEDIFLTLFIGVAYGEAPAPDLQEKSYYVLTWQFNETGSISINVEPSNLTKSLRIGQNIRKQINEKLTKHLSGLKMD